MISQKTSRPLRSSGALWIVLCVAVPISSAGQRSKYSQHIAGIKKSAAIDASIQQGAGRLNDITITCDGMQPLDFINVRPVAERQVIARAASLQPCHDCSVPVTGVKEGVLLPDSSLAVTANSVQFTRPSAPGEAAFLDVGIPAGSRVSLAVNGKSILNAALTSPVAYRNQGVEVGANTTSAAMARTIGGLQGQGASNEIVYDRKRRAYFVPFEKLKPLEIHKAGSATSAFFFLLIDENGAVVKATPMKEETDPGIRSAVERWRFAPYEVKGRAVKVMTLAVTN